MDYPQNSEDTWKNWCFTRECKNVQGFAAPITKAEAFASWMNSGYSWLSCERYWKDCPTTIKDLRSIDQESRDGMKSRLWTPALNLNENSYTSTQDEDQMPWSHNPAGQSSSSTSEPDEDYMQV